MRPPARSIGARPGTPRRIPGSAPARDRRPVASARSWLRWLVRRSHRKANSGISENHVIARVDARRPQPGKEGVVDDLVMPSLHLQLVEVRAELRIPYVECFHRYT